MKHGTYFCLIPPSPVRPYTQIPSPSVGLFRRFPSTLLNIFVSILVEEVCATRMNVLIGAFLPPRFRPHRLLTIPFVFF